MPQTDTLKLLFTYTISLVVIAGGLVFLYATRSETGIEDIRVVVAGFIGSALTWTFGAETSTRVARQTERAMRAMPPTDDAA